MNSPQHLARRGLVTALASVAAVAVTTLLALGVRLYAVLR